MSRLLKKYLKLILSRPSISTLNRNCTNFHSIIKEGPGHCNCRQSRKGALWMNPEVYGGSCLNTGHQHCNCRQSRKGALWMNPEVYGGSCLNTGHQTTSSGEYKEPLIIGVTESTIAVIRRKRPYVLKYEIWPHSMVRVITTCVHLKQLTIERAGKEQIVAVLADLDRPPREVTETWEKWTDLNLQTPSRAQRKDKVKKGKYKVKTEMTDPFEGIKNFMENKTSFHIDDRYFNFWIPIEERYPQNIHPKDEDKSVSKGCCPC